MQLSRQTKLVIAMSIFTAAVVVLASVAFDMSIERAILLAPVLVVSVGVLAGLALFWGKVAISQFKGTDQPFSQPGGRRPRSGAGGRGGDAEP